MACKSDVVFLPCEYSGVGFTARPVPDDSTRIQLMKGHGKNFPPVTKGFHFYITVEGCNSCCEKMRVIGIEGDVLVVERGLSEACTCIKSNARVSYTTECKEFYKDITSVLNLNVQSPLAFDCATNTLSIDCSALFKKGCGCGCECDEGKEENGANTPASEGQPSTGGLRGQKGDKGEPGPLPIGINISATGSLTFTYPDGTTIPATGKVPRGPKGDKGDPGEVGRPGDPGTAGDTAPSIAQISADGRTLVITMSNDEVKRVENSIPAPVPGAKGDKGDPGEKGKDGAPSAQVVFSENKWYVYSEPNTKLRLSVKGVDKTVTTGEDGLVEAELNLFPKGSLIKIYKDNALLGVGVV